MMKKIAMAPMIVCTFFACSKVRQAATGALAINEGSCVQAKVTDGKVRVCYEALVEESRCPLNVQCVWAGRAVVRLSLSSGAEKHSLLLATNKAGSGPSADTTVGGLTIHLQDVQPYPGGSAATNRSVVVQIVR